MSGVTNTVFNFAFTFMVVIHGDLSRALLVTRPALSNQNIMQTAYVTLRSLVTTFKKQKEM